jgi:hypothetical protein
MLESSPTASFPFLIYSVGRTRMVGLSEEVVHCEDRLLHI